MHNLKACLDLVFSDLVKYNFIERNPSDTEGLVSENGEIWKINTEVSSNDFIKEVTLFIVFDISFPLNIPDIYLSKKSYDEIKYIPHVDCNRFVCLCHKDTLILDQSQPSMIVKTFIDLAKRIISDGINKINISEIEDEFLAYWEQQYENEEKISNYYYILFTKIPDKSCEINLAYFSNNEYFLYLYDNEIRPFEEYYKNCKPIIKSKALFIKDFQFNDCPPFSMKNEYVINNIPDESITIHKQYINKQKTNCVIISCRNIKDKYVYCGWKYKNFPLHRNGFREKKPYEMLSTFNKKDFVSRIYCKEYSNNRIENRTAGKIETKYSFLIAGLGSIGSNLVYFLNGINYPNFIFVDNDILTIENIGRHLLGFQHIGNLKVKAMEKYIKSIRPDQKITPIKKKIENLLFDDIDFINNNDYIFIAIANQNIENYIFELLNNKKITKPVFILWVEPYLLGGHCLFLNPENLLNYNSLYNEIYYKYNVISNEEYKSQREILSKQEAGCQSAYTPYSANDVLLFLSSIYQYINDIIKNSKKESMIIQWIGNTSIAQKLDIKIKVNDKYKINIIDGI